MEKNYNFLQTNSSICDHDLTKMREQISKSWPRFTKMRELNLNRWPHIYFCPHVMCRALYFHRRFSPYFNLFLFNLFFTKYQRTIFFNLKQKTYNTGHRLTSNIMMRRPFSQGSLYRGMPSLWIHFSSLGFITWPKTKKTIKIQTESKLN